MQNVYISKRPSIGGRTRSASVGRDKKSDLRARYWASLLENLQHAIDKLYQTCEIDENISECEEVISMLGNRTCDFQELTKRFRVKCDDQNPPALQRPTSLTWGVNKSSPGKIFRKSCQPKYESSACRELIFELDPLSSNSTETCNVLPVHMKLNLNHMNNVEENSSKKGVNVDLSDTLIQTVDLKTKLSKLRSVDTSCQTEDDTLAIKKTLAPGRKVINSSPSYTRKLTRNLSTSMSVVPDKTISSKRPACSSPRKPVPIPGRNPAAPPFVPGKKVMLTKPSESKMATDKLKIARSKSDSIFETSNSLLKSQHNDKQYASVECVNSDSREECGFQPPAVKSMQVIVENKISNGNGTDENKNEQMEETGEFVPKQKKPVMEPLKSDATTQMNSAPLETVIKVSHTPAVAEITPLSPSSNSNPSLVPMSDIPKSQITLDTKSDSKSKRLTNDKNKPPSSDTNRRVEPRKVLPKMNTPVRLATRQCDMKTQPVHPPPRKVDPVLAPSNTRASIQNYFKQAGVPKVFNEAKDTRSTSERTIASELDKLPKSSIPSSYSTATKSKSKEFHNVKQNTEQDRRYPNIVRSKTSIDIKSKTQPPKSAPVKTCSEERELNPRRRSSKDTDGWETVMSRSRRSIPNSVNQKDKPKAFDMNKRFYEPSPSTSLPTLSSLGAKEKSPDSIKSEKNKNRNRNVSQGSGNCNGKVEGVHNEYNYKLNKERPILSNMAMFTAVPPKRKKASNKRKSSKESDKQLKEDLLNEESLRKSKELYEKEISLQQEINDLQNDDLEIDMDSDSTEVDSEATDLNKELRAEERRALIETKYSHLMSNLACEDQLEVMDKLEKMLMERDPNGKSLKHAKKITSLEQFEEFMSRWPGRALELHQKLSSPSRKRFSPDSTILQHKARQAKAKQKRDQLLQDKATKMKELFLKVGEVKTMQAMLVEERRKSLNQKLKRAEENRNLHLKNIQEKAHDEAKKQKEIAFINELEAQNKRHNLNTLFQEQEDRLQSILEKRQRRKEEKKAKEAAKKERKKAIEAAEQEKIEELQKKILKREERIYRESQEKERERIKMAREKARDREDRLLALQAAQIANVEELQKKIQQKQENSARRHEESIEQIRQRAIEIGTPRLTPYQINKLCSICNVLIDSEVFLLSHLRGINHQEALRKYREQFDASVKFSECCTITDAPAAILLEKRSKEKERQKTLRKRSKKIRQRLTTSSEKYLKDVSSAKEPGKKADTPSKKRLLKSIKEVEKLINTEVVGSWSSNSVTTLERNLFEMCRILERGDKNDQDAFNDFDGFTMLSNIYNFALDLPKNMSPYLPLKCFVVASNLYTSACNDNVNNCLYVLLSNNIVQLLEFLLNRLNLIMPNSDDRNGTVVYKADTVADALMNLCSIILSSITQRSTLPANETGPASADVSRHLQDVVGYIVCTGIVDKLAVYCSSVHDNKSADSFFLLHAIQLLTRLVETRPCSITEDSTSLMATLKATELVGAVSMLYAMLLHQVSLSADTQLSMIILQPEVVNVIMATLQLFSRVCELNVEFFQNILGAEGISLQVRHIISYLLKYCVQNEGYTDLLHQVIEFIGFFAIHHHDNQMILQSGSTPTVLQQLSNLPFAYFSNPNLVRILFPTLLACCVDNPQNKMILEQEMSFQLLEDFINSGKSKDIPLIKLLR